MKTAQDARAAAILREAIRVGLPCRA